MANKDNYAGFTIGYFFSGLAGAKVPQADQVIADMVTLGATWCRLQIPWRAVESSPGVYDWRALDEAVNAANVAGVNIEYTIQFPPTSSGFTGYTTPCSCDSTYSFMSQSATLTFVKQVAARYNGTTTNALTGQAQKALTLQGIEIGNEDFDLQKAPTCCRDLGGSYLGPIMVQCVPAIHAIHPTCIVGPGALLMQNTTHITNWLNAYFAAGAGPYTPYINFHFYKNGGTYPVGQAPENGNVGFTLYWQTIQQALAANGYGTLPIWLTECGYDAPNAENASTTVNTDEAHRWQYTQYELDQARQSGAIQKLFLYTIGDTNAKSLTDGGAFNNTTEVYQQSFYNLQAYITQYPSWTVGISASASSMTFSGVAGTSDPLPQTLTITNGGASSVTYTATDDATWLTETPTSGTLAAGASATLTVSATVVANHMAAGTYTGHLTVTASNGTSVVVTVTLNVSSAVVVVASSRQKTQVVQIFDSKGNFIDTGRDFPLLAGFKETINSATTPIQVQLPRPFDAYDGAGQPGSRGTIQQGNVVKYYLFGPGLPTSGLLRYQGVIDGWAPQITEAGEESVTVTITPQSSVLGDHGIVAPLSFGTANMPATYVDPVAMFSYFFTTNDPGTGKPYMYPLTLDPASMTSSPTPLMYTFAAQNMLSTFQTILLMLPPNAYFRCNPNNTVTLQVSTPPAQHTWQLGQHLVNPQYSQDWTQFRNDIYVSGASTTTTVNGVTTTNTISARVQGADIATFGQRLYTKNDSRITDPFTAAVVARGLLNFYDRPLTQTKVRIPDYRGDNQSGLGYDIESLRVGDMVVINDAAGGAPATIWGQFVWGHAVWGINNGGAINQLVPITEIGYNFDSCDITLGTLPPSQDRSLWEVASRFSDFSILS